MKKSRALKRGLCVVWMLACVLGSLVTAHAASAKSAAMADYKTFMAGQGSYLEFGVIYLDKDTIPELVLNNGRIYTWKKASGMKLLQDDYEFDYQKYYKKKGVIYSDIIPGAVMDYDVGIYSRVSGGKLVQVTRQEHYTNGSWIYYNAKNKKISKAKSKALIKKYVKSKKITKIKYYANTAANRDKYLK